VRAVAEASVSQAVGAGNDVFVQHGLNAALYDLTGGLGDDAFTLVINASGHGIANFNYNMDFTAGTGGAGPGSVVHECLPFALTNLMTQASLATQYSKFLQSLIDSGFGHDVDGDGKISYDIGQNHANPTSEGATIVVTQDQLLTVTTGKTTQGRDVATKFDISNEGTPGTSASLSSNDGHDIINGFVLNQDHITLQHTAGNVNDGNFSTFFAVTNDGANTFINTVAPNDNFQIELAGVVADAGALLAAHTFQYGA
jgi:hypothetical protein